MHPLPPAAECSPSSAFIADSGLEIKVCIGSYKLFFVPETEDFFARRLSEGEERERKGEECVGEVCGGEAWVGVVWERGEWQGEGEGGCADGRRVCVQSWRGGQGG
jgi:hypothetical protein